MAGPNFPKFGLYRGTFLSLETVNQHVLRDRVRWDILAMVPSNGNRDAQCGSGT
jgi:hypothetical protein